MTPGENDLCIFAVKRGELLDRFDTKYVNYHRLIVETSVSSASFGELSLIEPCYGTSARAVDRTSDTQPKYIRITDFDDLGIEPGHTFMTVKSYSAKHVLQKNDVLFARTGGTVGKTFFYDGSIGPAIFAGYCIRFRFDEKKVLPKFAYWCTKTESYNAWVDGIQRPSGQPNINKEEFKSYRITLPDLDQQRKRIQVIEAGYKNYLATCQHANDLSAKTKSHIFNLIGVTFSDYKPSIFSYQTLRDIFKSGIYCNPHSAYLNELFEQLRINKWYAGQLDEFVDINPQTDRSLLSDEVSVSFVPMPAVEEKTNHVEYETKKYREVKTGFTIFQQNDLLWAKITPCMQNGKSFLASDMPTDIGFASTEFHVLRQKSDQIYMPYLWVILSESHVLEAAQGMFSGSAGQQRVPDTFLKKFPIVLPPIELQKELANEVFAALRQSKEMKIAAEKEWAETKAEFERALLEG